MNTKKNTFFPNVNVLVELAKDIYVHLYQQQRTNTPLHPLPHTPFLKHVQSQGGRIYPTSPCSTLPNAPRGKRRGPKPLAEGLPQG